MDASIFISYFEHWMFTFKWYVKRYSNFISEAFWMLHVRPVLSGIHSLLFEYAFTAVEKVLEMSK